MFHIVYTSGSKFKQLLDSMKDIVNDVNVNITADGLSMRAMDSGHVAFVCLDIPSQDFDVYECAQETTLGLNIQNMCTIFKCLQGESKVHLSQDEDNENVLTIQFKGETQNADFCLNLMVIESDDVEIPEMDSVATLSVSASSFQKSITNLSHIGDTCVFTIAERKCEVSTKGDIGTAKLWLCDLPNLGVPESKEGDDEDEDDEAKENDKIVKAQSFSMKYLGLFSKASSLSSQVVLEMYEEFPMRLKYKFGNASKLSYYIAPKIDED